MPDYSKGLIYKWVCDDCDEVYVGSTTNFTRRKNAHKTVCNNEKAEKHHLKIYQTMREYGGFDNWRMIQIETYPCESKRELQAREEDVRKELNAKLNQIRAFLREEERKVNLLKYQETNQEHILEKHRQWYANNRDKIKARQREYDKIRYQQNSDKERERSKLNYQKNSDKIKEKHNCECGGHYIHCLKARHLKSKKHQNYINAQN